MDEFKTWFFIGFEHIMDIQALDHTLFILALVVAYDSSQLKKIIFLVTAFTIGHSVTLVLSALELINFNQRIIEFCIPFTIFLTATNNIVNRKESKKKFLSSNYIIGLVFGLIHGLGFANYLKALLFKGNIVTELFSFNVGIEAAQIILVIVFLFISFLFSKFVFSKREDWILFISSLIMGISLILMSNAKFW